MRLSTQVKPISYVKANAAQIIDDLEDGGAPIVVTKNGEAKAIMMSVHEYEREKEAHAFLKVLDLAERDVALGNGRPAADVIARIKAKLADAAK